MIDQQAETFDIRTLSVLPEGQRPRQRRPGRARGKFWSRALGDGIPPTRPTVAHPAALPFGSVALLNFFKRTAGKPRYLGYATGFFVQPDLVMTAGHNLTMSSADIIGVYPAWDARLNETHALSALRWCRAASRDISLLLTPPGPGAHIPLNGTLSPVAKLVGYASDYPDGTNRMSSGTGPCDLHGNRLVYNIDAQQADSGGPILSATDAVMAIHVDLIGRPDGMMVGSGEHVDGQLLALMSQLEAQLRGHP